MSKSEANNSFLQFRKNLITVAKCYNDKMLMISLISTKFNENSKNIFVFQGVRTLGNQEVSVVNGFVFPLQYSRTPVTLVT